MTVARIPAPPAPVHARTVPATREANLDRHASFADVLAAIAASPALARARPNAPSGPGRSPPHEPNAAHDPQVSDTVLTAAAAAQDLPGRGSAPAAFVTDPPAPERAARVAFNAARGVDAAAVAFEARPLVGPAAVQPVPGGQPPPAAPAVALPAGHSLEAAGSTASAAASAPAPVGNGDAAGGSVTAHPLSSPQARQTASSMPPLRLGTPTAVPSVAPRARPNSAPCEVAAGSGAAPAHRRVASQPRIASLAIAPHEIVVTVRGVALSDGERAALAEQVRALVAQTHPGARAVRIVPLSRSA